MKLRVQIPVHKSYSRELLSYAGSGDGSEHRYGYLDGNGRSGFAYYDHKKVLGDGHGCGILMGDRSGGGRSCMIMTLEGAL